MSAREAGPSAATGSARPRWIAPAIIVTVVIAVVLRMGATEPLPGDAVESTPPEIVGHWTNQDAGYGDRYLSITADEVELGVGDEGFPRGGPILSVRRWQEGTTPVVRVEYETPEGVDRFEMLLEPSGSMRLRNPPNVVWTRR